MRDNYKVSNLQIDFNKIDPVFIPIISRESLEGYRCALYTNKYWDNFKIDIMLIENEVFLNNEEKEKILVEIDNSLVII